MLGCTVFSNQYSSAPEELPAKEIIDHAFIKGIKAIDTSPYYSNSEKIVGVALNKLSVKHPRESYFLQTKCGRININTFDYSPQWILKSVYRSLRRMNTVYLDSILLHDVEFVSSSATIKAAKVLFDLKKKEIVHNVGISGFPLECLADRAKKYLLN